MREITFQGKPLTLVGRNLEIGQVALNFHVVTNELKEKSLEDFGDTIKLVTSFPSLDTSVCDAQVKEFNKRASGLSKEIVLVAISKDLPFAQKRFCDHFLIKNLFVFSDYQTSSFGINYGLLIKELNLLARSVMILDKNNIIRYRQIVKELTQPPNYDDVMKYLEEVVKHPTIKGKNELPTHCIPCEGKVKPIAMEKVKSFIVHAKGWECIDEKKLVKEFVFPEYIDARYFLDLIANIAEEERHHPTLTLTYNKVKVTLSTHAAGGVTDNDLVMARIIDSL